MNSKERVQAVLNREQTDRIPVDIWLVPELIEQFKQNLNVDNELDIYRKLEIDKIVWQDIPRKNRIPEDPDIHTIVNSWGVKFEKIKANTGVEYGEVCHNPLKDMTSIRQLDHYPWPDPDDFDYKAAASECEKLTKEFAVLGPWVSLFEVYCQMRGLENALMDTAAEKAFLHRSLDYIAEIQGKMLRRFLTAANKAVDMVFISDDMGTQKSLLMSPAAFDEFIFPRLKAWCDIVHSFNCRVFFHTDGAAEPLIPRLIEAGADILNPVQHVCPGMDCLSIKKKYGDSLIFHGAVDNQSVLPFGTAKEVKKETLRCLNELGPNGFIPCSCHFAQAHTPVENILALIETVQQY